MPCLRVWCLSSCCATFSSPNLSKTNLKSLTCRESPTQLYTPETAQAYALRIGAYVLSEEDCDVAAKCAAQGVCLLSATEQHS